jgi:hypothetical protein|tara:strand:- start:186 stop:1376 length:1191 start_codon:yes stop_codon:yes gene_type:complete
LFSWFSINIYNKIKQLKNSRLNNIIKKALKEESLTGNATAASVYGHVNPSFTFKSRGPQPGRIYSPGFNYESKGPLGVSYFMEDDGEGPNPWAICTTSLGLEGKKRKDYTQTEKSNYEKCVLSIKKEVKENHIKRIAKKVINEQNYYPSANPWNVNPLQQCQNCMWFVNNAAQQGLNWSFADCQTPCGSPTTALYDGQLDCQMCKMWFPQNLWSTKCSTLCSSAWYNMWEINPCFRCNNNPKSPTFNQPNPNLNLPANVVEVLNYSSWGKSQGPCPSGAEKDWPDLNMGKGCEIQQKIDKVDFDTPKGVTEPVKPLGVDKVHDGPRDYEPSNNDMMESDLRRIVNKVINEQETTYRDGDSGKKVQSSVQLDVITGYLSDIFLIVQNLENNLSRRWQ